MKVLHVVPAILNGGVASVLYDLVKSQCEAGLEVTIYVSRPQFFQKAEQFQYLGATTLHSKYANRFDPRHILELRSLFKSADLVHIHLFPDQFFASCAWRSLSMRVRPCMVTTEHNTFNNRRKYKILKYIDRWMYSCYSSIINISEASKTNLDSWLKKPALIEKSITINNGVDISKYSEAEDIIRNEIKLSSDDKIVIMVSRLTHPKDPVTLLKAIAKCDEKTHVVFIGYGPLELELQDLAKTMGIKHRVHLLGRKDSAAPFLKGCDIGVLSTYWDGFGLVAVEYMAAGLPVLASDVEGLRDVVGYNDNIFKVGNVEQLYKLIVDLLTNKDKYNKQKAYFSERAKQFDKRKMTAAYLDLYSKLVKI